MQLYKLIYLTALISAVSVMAQTPAQLKRVQLPVPKNIIELKDVTYGKVGDRELKMEFYRPKDKKVRPGIVLIHGGGWIKGSRATFQAVAVLLAKEGFAVCNISYRLAGEAKFPAAVEDCKTAVRWMRAHAKQYHIDSKNIFAFGGSAGGHLAGMVATSGPGKFEGKGGWEKFSSEVQGAVLMGAGVDQVKRAKEAKRPMPNCVTFFGGEYKDVPEIYKKGSPITHVSKKTPPILFLDGEKDRPGQRYIDIIKLMNTLGVKNKSHTVKGAKHGQWRLSPYREEFVKASTKFFKEIAK